MKDRWIIRTFNFVVVQNTSLDHKKVQRHANALCRRNPSTSRPSCPSPRPTPPSAYNPTPSKKSWSPLSRSPNLPCSRWRKVKWTPAAASPSLSWQTRILSGPASVPASATASRSGSRRDFFFLIFSFLNFLGLEFFQKLFFSKNFRISKNWISIYTI